MSALPSTLVAGSESTAAAVATGVASHAVGGPLVRNEAFDCVKGCLVLVMVLYHWLNYFVGFGWDGYRYLRFLTPSFIFITGFLVSHVYLERFAYDSPVLRRRLLERGAKLLALFLALNAADTAVAARSLSPARLPSLWPSERVTAVLLGGDGAAAFGILLPIAYFLMLTPFVLLLSRRLGASLPVMAGLGVVGTIFMSVSGYENPHLELLSIALIGLATGTVGMGRIEALVDRPAAVLIAYALYVIAITVWNVPFWLQVFGVSLSLLLLYVTALAWKRPETLKRQVTNLGKYSLFAYVAQIAVLQALSRGLPVEHLARPTLALTLILAVALTITAVRSVAVLRVRSTAVDTLYRLVFA